METKKMLYVTSRKKWRAWLEKNYDSEKVVWLIFYKRHTGKPVIPYDEAVEEAVCFGWIDSIIKKIDEEKFVRKFTPRTDKSKWSELNKKRAQKMINEGRMTGVGLSKIDVPLTVDKKKAAPKLPKEEPVIPLDLKKALKASQMAWENFNNFAPSYQRLYVGWISSAKRDETRKKRIREAVTLAEKNIKTIMK